MNVDRSERKFVGNTLGIISIVLLLLLVLHPAAVWSVSAAASGNMMVTFFFGALFLSVGAGLMASRWWLCLSGALFALYLFIAVGEGIWEWRATGGHW